jgi:ADP-ribose pyrophosphatase YjhB (NUDIX family)
MEQPDWLIWGRKLHAIAQNGLTYSQNPFDIERYEMLKEVATEIISQGTETSLVLVKGIFDQQCGYITPKLDVRGAVFQDEKILLVKEINDGGKWTLPGGWVDVNEPPSYAVEKEVREESGFKVKAQRLVMVLDRDKHNFPPVLFHTYKLFFICDILGGTPADSIETEGAAFFSEEEIPQLSTSRTTEPQIARLFEYYRNPNYPTDFD